MQPRPTCDLEAVLAQSSWVRALAERLVRDPGDAEDIVQETWIAAERRRPGLENGLRPWLAAVVRKLALRKRRDRARVESRERAAARAEATPSADEIVLRDELRALVGRSLAEIDEPFRTTLILRYFAGLEPSEIAAREGVPPATVRTRLKRGLEKLRKELDRRHGGREAWSAAFIGLFDRIDAAAAPPLAAGPAAVGGGIAMHLGWKLGMAAAAVALTAWVGWQVLGEERGIPPEEASAELPVSSLERSNDDLTAEDLSVGAPPSDRGRRSAGTGAPAAAEPAPAAAAAVVAIVSGRVLDAGGRPIAGAGLDRAKEGGASRLSDAEGRFRLEIALPNPLRDSFETSLLARKAGFATRSITTIVRRSAPTDVGDVVLQRACAVSGRLEDEGGRPIAGTALAGPAALVDSDPDRLRRLGPRYDALATHAPQVSVGADGAFSLDDVEPGALRVWGTAGGRGWVSSEPLDLAAGERRAALVLRLAPLGRSDSIVGHVLAPDGSPVENARIDATFQTPEYATSIAANTDAAGRFELLVQSNVPHELFARDREDRWSKIVMGPVNAGEQDLELRFEEPREFDIHVKSRKGGAVSEFEAHATQIHQIVQGISFGPIESTKRGERHEDGHARMRLPGVPFELEIDAPGFAEAKLGPLDPQRMPPRIEFELEPMPGLEGRVIADPAGGVDLTGTKVELHEWMGSDGSCAWKNGYRVFYGNHSEVTATTGADGKFRLDLRRSGRVVLLAFPPKEVAGRFPTAELGPLELDARVGAKGLEIRMTPGGSIEGRVLVPSGQSAAGRIVAMNHGDAEPFTVRTDGEGRFRAESLAPGNWQVMLATEEVLQSTSNWTSQAEEEAPNESQLWTCRVDVGRTTRVELDDRHSRAGSLVGRLTLEGGSAEGWIATLRDAAAMRPEAVSGSSATLDREGKFELRFEREGLHRLALSAPGEPGAALTLRAEVTVEAGGNEWGRSLALGKLAGSGLVVPPGEEALFRYTAKAKEIEASCRISPLPNGDFTLPFVIAGSGSLERFQPVAGESWSRWKEIATFVVPAGAEAFVRAP